MTLSALCLVASLMLVEPGLGGAATFGDLLDSEQYLFIAPAGELSYFFPPIRRLPTSLAAAAALPLFLAGLFPALRKARADGLDRFSGAGFALVALGLAALGAEYKAKREWVLVGRIGARYLAMTCVAVGAFLACRDRRFLAALGAGGFSWDLSSAIFWACLSRSPRAKVPVPWHHHFGDEEAMGAPCWLVALLDSTAIGFFLWLGKSGYDPFGLFVTSS